jgi:hypothetical protein
MAKVMIERVLRSNAGRVQTSPQAWRVIISWNSRVKSFWRDSERSTWASPSTARRTLRPSS